MVTFLRNPVNIGGKQVVEVACLSTDTKPTSGICNGSLCLEINTGKIFAYDEAGDSWEEIGSSGGGGGGGSGDFTTATVTVVNNSGNLITILLPRVGEEGGSAPVISEAGTYEVILHEGVAYGAIDEGVISVTGDIEDDGGDIIITGDGTITIS